MLSLSSKLTALAISEVVLMCVGSNCDLFYGDQILDI